jgi:anti-sigma factor RsiW
MNNTTINCTAIHEKLADLLLDPAAVSAEVHAHVDACEACAKELAGVRSAMSALDAWEAPEPSPYFMTRLDARMREEREAEPANWLARQFARLRADFAYGPQTHVRPVAAMALTVMLLVGGGTYLGVTDWNHSAQPVTQTAVIGDLQTMDSNAQVLDQLESLSNNESGN